MDPSWVSWFFSHTWTLEVAGALLFLLLCSYGIKRILSRATRAKWETILLRPFRIVLWTLLLSFFLDILGRENEWPNLVLYVDIFRDLAITSAVAWALLRGKRWFVASYKGGKPRIDPSSQHVIGKIGTVLILFLTALVFLQIFGLDIVPLMTFGGIGAAAIGIAAKDVLANFFGGMMLYLTRPFSLGDTVEIPQKKLFGTIEEIGWYFSMLRDMQKKPIYVPNALFSTEIVINFSRMTHRRIEEEIQLHFRDTEKTPTILAAIRNLLQTHAGIDQQENIYVFLRTFGPYSANLDVQAYTTSTRYDDFMKTKQEVLLAIYHTLQQLDVDMPFPTMTVYSQ